MMIKYFYSVQTVCREKSAAGVPLVEKPKFFFFSEHPIYAISMSLKNAYGVGVVDDNIIIIFFFYYNITIINNVGERTRRR